MTKIRNPKLDDTWRLITRVVMPQNAPPPLTGQDCYMFQRAAEPDSHHLWWTHFVPVEEFWKMPEKSDWGKIAKDSEKAGRRIADAFKALSESLQKGAL